MVAGLEVIKEIASATSNRWFAQFLVYGMRAGWKIFRQPFWAPALLLDSGPGRKKEQQVRRAYPAGTRGTYRHVDLPCKRFL